LETLNIKKLECAWQHFWIQSSFWIKVKLDPMVRWKVTHPKILDGLNYESKSEDNRKKRGWGALFGTQHFEGRGAFWSSGIKTRKIEKQFNYSHKPAQTKQQVS